MRILVSHLPRLLLEEENHILSPLAAPPPYSRHPHSTSLRPSIAVIVIILTTIFSLTFLLLLYAKHCNRHVTNYNSGNGNLPATERRNSGVNRSIVDSLPVFRFSSLTGHKDGLDCAVCLTRFEQCDVLRLLPKCKHGFHVECVGIWLEAHSTCPLCRVRVDPEDVLLVVDPNPNPITNPEPQKGAAFLPFVRRISGRHSSAGEKRSSLVQIAARRRSEGGDGGATVAVNVGCFDRVRKDGMLSTTESTAAEREEFERRFSHRINVVSDGGDGALERWSDLKPSDLLYLRSEMILPRSESTSGRNVNSLRSVSEITGVSRFREREEKTMNKWMGFKAKRPVTEELTSSSGK